MSDIAQLQEALSAAQRLMRVKEARTDFLKYCQYMLPDPTDVDDPEATLFEIAPHHKLFADILMKVERGELQRVAISVPPRHGKSEMFTRLFSSWFAGKDPSRQVMLVGYSQEFAENEFGRKIKPVMETQRYKQVFPRATLRDGSKSVKNMMFDAGGMIASIGAGAALTGRGGDLIVIDDPISNSEDANSDTFRQKLWEWFTTTAFSRLMPGGRIVVIHTRWSEDDLIGRLCDPSHPEHNAELAAKWTYINIPAVIESENLSNALGMKLERPTDPDVLAMLGDKPMTALWPDRYGLPFFSEVKRQDERAFYSLYQGNPTPDDGDFYRRDWFKEYRAHDLPDNLRRYIACDFAISSREDRDKSCFLVAGIDDRGDIWILDDIFWGREGNADRLTDELIRLMKKHTPMMVFAESGHISKSLLPFLRKKMNEQDVFSNLDDSLVPVKDKITRARAFQGMMSMGRVHWPKYASWYPDARQELLKFPNATHDDFVDATSWLGLKLEHQIRASKPRKEDKIVNIGTMRWIREQHDKERKHQRRVAGRKGM
jgi:predicted phage terminase large subunit-like protein